MNSNFDRPMQRVGPLVMLPGMLTEFGLDPQMVFSGLGIRPDEMLADNRIPYDTALALLDRSARLSGNPNFGLLLGGRHDQRCLGVVGDLMSSAPTLRRALQDYIGVQAGYSGGACVYLVPMGDCYALGYGIYDRHAPGADQVYGLTLAVGVNIVRALSGGLVAPIEVHICQRPPVDRKIYEKTLRTRISFNAHQSCLFLPREMLDTPNPLADRQMHERLSALMSERMQFFEKSIAMRLRHILRPAVSVGEASLEHAADQLGLSDRSLNRRLSEAGTTFASERDLVRFRMACELLLLTDLPIGEVAAAVSYANHSAFIRSFRRWSGNTPLEWRSQHSLGGPLDQNAKGPGDIPASLLRFNQDVPSTTDQT